jgi:hypothetical protein
MTCRGTLQAPWATCAAAAATAARLYYVNEPSYGLDCPCRSCTLALDD